MDFPNIIERDLIARNMRIGDITTPAMSISKNNKLVIFENFHGLEQGRYVEIDQDIVHGPHLIPQYKEEKVSEVISEFISTLGKGEIVSISYYKDPKVYSGLKEKKPRAVLIRDLILKRSPRQLINFLLYLRETLPTDTIIHLTSYVPWKLIPFVIYMGVDIIDVAGYLMRVFREKENAVIGLGSPFLIYDYKQSIRGLSEQEKTKKIIQLNKGILNKIFNDIRKSIQKGILRNIIEVYSHIDQDTDKILAILDNEHVEVYKKRISLRKPKINVFVGMESFSRPLIKWYDERIEKRYIPPKTPRIIILLPCSARKPYSTSKSHTLFRNAITKVASGKMSIIHEVILTSPIGLVPRELESTYPNAHYDTTTTGNWNEWELEHTAQLLEIYLKKKKEYGGFDWVLVHLDGGYKEAALRALERLNIDYIDTAGNNHVTEFEALENLAEKLGDILSEVEVDLASRKQRVLEDARGILSYQFGVKVASELIKNAEVEGSPMSKGRYQIKNIATFDREYGLFIPLKGGAQVLVMEDTYTVTVKQDSIIEDDYVKGNQIVAATRDIIPGDYVAIKNTNEEILGVGLTNFTGSELQNLIGKTNAIRIIKKF